MNAPLKPLLPDETMRITPWHQFLAWLSFLICTIGIYQASVIPPRRLPRFLLRLDDKLIHGIEFFLLFWVAFNAFRSMRFIKHQIYAAYLSLLYCMVLGVMTEFSQRFVPYRSCDWRDWLADFAGACLALGLFNLFNAVQPQPE